LWDWGKGGGEKGELKWGGKLHFWSFRNWGYHFWDRWGLGRKRGRKRGGEIFKLTWWESEGGVFWRGCTTGESEKKKGPNSRGGNIRARGGGDIRQRSQKPEGSTGIIPGETLR